MTTCFDLSLPDSALSAVSGPSGAGKTQAVLRFLASKPEFRVAWIEDHLSIYPLAFSQQGVDLHRVLFIEAQKELLWSALTVLRSGLFRAVVLSTQIQMPNQIGLRRLQLAAEQSGTSCVILTEEPICEGKWTISYQAHIQGLKFHLIKNRRSVWKAQAS